MDQRNCKAENSEQTQVVHQQFLTKTWNIRMGLELLFCFVLFFIIYTDVISACVCVLYVCLVPIEARRGH